MFEIQLLLNDITTLNVDAIVNAANSSLLGGGGVDGAIHKAAGSGLLDECKTLNGCNTGQAKITNAYLLPSKYIIHTVGPVYNQHPPKKAAQLLSAAYINSLAIVEQYNIKTIAFPNVSTGVYAYPKREAAKVAIQSVREFAKKDTILQKLIFCCYDEENYRIYQRILEE